MRCSCSIFVICTTPACGIASQGNWKPGNTVPANHGAGLRILGCPRNLQAERVAQINLPALFCW
jgi:hypothetical protein